MKEKLMIQQLRSTIFLPQNNGYTPDKANNLRSLLLPDSKVYGIVQNGVPVFGVSPLVPQFGMPWRLFKKCNDGREYNISFLPGKIDVVLGKEVPYGDAIEEVFCNESSEIFKKILDKQGDVYVTRIAFSPLYAIVIHNDENDRNIIWGELLKRLGYGGLQMNDISLSFLLKRIIRFGENEIHMNLLHNIFDGIQTRTEDNVQKIRKVLMLQLDLNSVAEKSLSLDANGVNVFFREILSVKNDLVNNVAK